MIKQKWECTVLLPSGDRVVTVETVSPPMAQASAEVAALRRAGYDNANHNNPRCLFSRFLGEELAPSVT